MGAARNIMKRSIIIIAIAVVGISAGTYYWKGLGTSEASAPGGGGRSTSGANRGGNSGGGGFPGGGGFGGPGGFGGFGPRGGGPRLPMTVEVSTLKRAHNSDNILLVRHLIRAATGQSLPEVAGDLPVGHLRVPRNGS